MEKFGYRQAGFVALICLIWSTNLIALKIIFSGISPICASGVRFTVGAAGLIAWVALRRIPFRVPRRHFHRLAIVAAMGVSIFVLFSTGLDMTTVQRGSILIYSQPIFTSVFAHFSFTDDRLTARKISGLILAFIGVTVVFAQGAAGGSLRGDALVLAAAVCWAYSTIYIKKVNKLVDPLLVILYELVMAAPALILIAKFSGERMIYAPAPDVFAALAYSGLVTVSYTFVAWNQLLSRYNASALTSFVFLTPVFGVILGGLFMHEGFDPKIIIALMLVAAGIRIVNTEKSKKNRGLDFVE